MTPEGKNETLDEGDMEFTVKESPRAVPPVQSVGDIGRSTGHNPPRHA